MPDVPRNGRGGQQLKPCRPRAKDEELDAYPFTGDDGDADAIRMLLDIQNAILDRVPRKHGNKPLGELVGEFLTHDDIETLTVLNHITNYLDNRAEYAKIADELRGYLVIE